MIDDIQLWDYNDNNNQNNYSYNNNYNSSMVVVKIKIILFLPSQPSSQIRILSRSIYRSTYLSFRSQSSWIDGQDNASEDIEEEKIDLGLE